MLSDSGGKRLTADTNAEPTQQQTPLHPVHCKMLLLLSLKFQLPYTCLLVCIALALGLYSVKPCSARLHANHSGLA